MEMWRISHYLGLGHETMTYAVCIAMFLPGECSATRWILTTCDIVTHVPSLLPWLLIVIIRYTFGEINWIIIHISVVCIWRWAMSTEGNPKYSRPAALVLGILQIICGVANIIVQITMFTEDLHTLAPFSIGIWTGIFVSDRSENEVLKSDETMMLCNICNIRHTRLESWPIFRPKYQHEALTWCQPEHDFKQAVSLPLSGGAMALMTSFNSIQSIQFVFWLQLLQLCDAYACSHIILFHSSDLMRCLFFQFIITGILALISFKANINCLVSDKLVQYLYVNFDAPIVNSIVAKWSPICVNDKYSNG